MGLCMFVTVAAYLQDIPQPKLQVASSEGSFKLEGPVGKGTQVIFVAACKQSAFAVCMTAVVAYQVSAMKNVEILTSSL